MIKSSLILHHYTDGNGILGIIESSSIWATKIQYMNDTKEFSHAIDLAVSFLNQYKNTETDETFHQICDEVAQRLQNMSELAVYVVCFSEVEDSLSQWRGYCPPSFGYSIGFDGKRLEKIANEQGFQLRPCIYDDRDQRNVIEKWVKSTVDYLSLSYDSGDDLSEFCRVNSGKSLGAFVNFAPYMKHHKFKDEKEWRLTSLISVKNPNLKLRPGKSMLIPYVPLELNLKEEESLIWNALVGPTPHIELAMDALGMYAFEKANFMNGIGRTMIPYRDW